MAKTALELANLLKNNASITALVQSSYIFPYAQVETRRIYPSIEVVLNQPESTTRTDELDSTSYSFEIRVYQRRKGTLADEITFFDAIEPLIVTVLTSTPLQDHRIILESKNWSREDDNLYAVSIIGVKIVQITKPTSTVDATLTFKVSGSDVSNAPALDRTYLCFNTEAYGGYGTAEYGVTGADNAIPVQFSTTYRSYFSTNVIVQVGDIGSTSDMLDQINKLKANMEHQIARLVYTNKTNTESPSQINNDVKVIINEVRFLYPQDQNVVFRVIGRFTQLPTLTIS